MNVRHYRRDYRCTIIRTFNGVYCKWRLYNTARVLGWQTSSLITVALLSDLRAIVIFLPRSANTISFTEKQMNKNADKDKAWLNGCGRGVV